MREIWFRGKRKDNGEWIENHTVVELRDGQKYIPNNSAPSGLKIDENGNKVSFVALFYEVIPETVGQFTGMFDSTKWEQLTEEEQLDWLKNHTIDEWNGRMIFEGDIVESKFTKNSYPVCFGEYTYIDEDGEESGACGWYNEEKGGYVTAFSQPDCWATVIGNIHDNPELLKGGAE